MSKKERAEINAITAIATGLSIAIAAFTLL